MSNKEQANKHNNDELSLIRYTFILFVSETGLGSFLHGLKIPLSGHFLSLNQSFWLTRLAIQRKDTIEPYYVSQVVSLLKTLSPAGKKLTPMLAISMQGFFFHLPLRVLGVNNLSLIISGILLSLWAFLQPILLYLIIFGKDLINVANYYLEKLHEVLNFVPEKLSIVLTIVILIKIILSISITIFAIFIKSELEESFEKKILKLTKINNDTPNYQNNILKGIIKDLTKPIFLITIILTAIFFYFQEHSFSKTLWMLLKPIGIAVVVFSFIRVYPIERMEKFLKKDSKTQKLFLKIVNKIKT